MSPAEGADGLAEVRALFAAEAAKRLEALERGLAAEEPDLAALFREAHTLKGSARVLGLDDAGVLAERLESAFAGAQEGEPLDREAARELVGRLRERVPEPAPRTVLCIEDSRPVAVLVERILRGRGIRTLTAESGTEGLQLARRERPDLVLADLVLPDMRGEEVVRRLREDPATAETPVAVVSGGVDPAEAERLQAAGVRTFIAKPFDAEALLEAVDEALRR